MAEIKLGAQEALRAAVLADVDAIAAFQTSCWREAYSNLVPPSYLAAVGTAARAERWHQRLREGTRSIVLAEVGPMIVGVVSWGLADGRDAPSLELKSLYVGQSRRGTGLAARLLHAALDQQAAHLWVFEGNARAQTFYRKHRFAADGERELDPDTALWMLRMTRDALPIT